MVDAKLRHDFSPAFQGRVAGTTTIVRRVATIEKARFSRFHRVATRQTWASRLERERPRLLNVATETVALQSGRTFGAWARLKRRYASLSSKKVFRHS